MIETVDSPAFIIFCLSLKSEIKKRDEYLKEMAKELGSVLFLTRKAPSRGTLISMFSAWLLDRVAWYHLDQTQRDEDLSSTLETFSMCVYISLIWADATHSLLS